MDTKFRFTRIDGWLVPLIIVLSGGSALVIRNLDNELGLYTLLGLLGIAMAMAMFVSPSLGANILIIAIFSNVSDELTNNGYPSVIKPLVLMVTVVIAVRYIYVEKKFPSSSRTSQIELFLFLLFIFVAASFLMASNKDRAINAILDLGKDIIIIFCIFFSLRTPDELKKSIWVVILITFLLSLLGLYQLISRNFSQEFFGFATIKMDQVFSGSTTPRLGGPINAPNMWGQTVVSVIVLVLFRIIHEKRLLARLIAVIILGVLLYETLNTYSRGAYLSLIVALILMFFLFEIRINPIITIAAITVVLITIPFLPPNYIERFQSLYVLTPSNENAIYQDSSIRGRSSEMLTGLSMFASSPFLGVGAGNYKNNYQEYTQKIGIEVRAEARDPHSLYIQLLAENGLLGFLAFVGAMVAMFKGLVKAKRSIQYRPDLEQNWAPWISSIQVSLVAYLIAATFLHGAYIRYFWVLFGLGCAAIRITAEMLDNENTVAL